MNKGHNWWEFNQLPRRLVTPMANLLVIKILFNSVISLDGAKFATADISNFYLMMPLKQQEFTNVKLEDIPEEIVKEYNLQDKAIPDGKGIHPSKQRNVWPATSRIIRT